MGTPEVKEGMLPKVGFDSGFKLKTKKLRRAMKDLGGRVVTVH